MKLPATIAEAVLLLAGLGVVLAGLTSRPRDSGMVGIGVGLLTTAAAMGAKTTNSGRRDGGEP